jgi:Zn-dependent peptidase ImmA (M78 family)
MNYSREAIENFSNLVREVLNLIRPYDPELAVKYLGGTIVQNITNMAIDASIFKSGDTGFIIRLNKNKPNPKDKSLIAHELGHLFLHMGYLVNNELWKSKKNFQDSVYYRMSGSYTQEEAEADMFAMAFLMPEDEFKEQMKLQNKNDGVDMSAIAEYFDVSVNAAAMRAKRLGYAQYI